MQCILTQLLTGTSLHCLPLPLRAHCLQMGDALTPSTSWPSHGPAVGAGLTGPNQSHAATQWPYSNAFYLMSQYTKVTMGYSVLVVVFFIFNAKPRKVSTLESFRTKENTSREISLFFYISIVCLYSYFSFCTVVTSLFT